MTSRAHADGSLFVRRKDEDFVLEVFQFGLRIEDEDGWETEVIGRTTVTLAGKEYVRQEIAMDYMGKTRSFYYARKLDDDLMLTIMFNIGEDESIEEYEKWFG